MRNLLLLLSLLSSLALADSLKGICVNGLVYGIDSDGVSYPAKANSGFYNKYIRCTESN